MSAFVRKYDVLRRLLAFQGVITIKWNVSNGVTSFMVTLDATSPKVTPIRHII